MYSALINPHFSQEYLNLCHPKVYNCCFLDSSIDNIEVVFLQNIPENIQQELMQFQQLQSQYQIIVNQLQSMKMEINETELALGELSKTENPVVYKSIGSILIKSEKADMLDDLNKKKESIGIRITTIEKQEDRVKKKLEEMQKNLQKALGGQPTSG